MGSKRREVHLYAGTRKGGFLFRSDERRKSWKVDGPYFSGWEVNHLTRDPRNGRLWAAINTSWWGNDVQFSADGGRTWQKSAAGLGFEKERGINLNRVWRVKPDRVSRPDTLWCGVDPGALFRSDDGGKNWSEIRALTEHPTRAKWFPGAGGMMVHVILLDPRNSSRMFVGISAAGCFRSDDDGASWQPMNKGVRTEFLPEKLPEVGQCVHSMVMSPANPNWLFQQNHCGVYRSRNAGEKWSDSSRGLPSRFGFAMAMHPREALTIYVVSEAGDQHRYVCNGRLGVYRSRDGGVSWELLTRGLPQKHVYTQVLRHAACTDPCEKAGVYLGTTGGEIFHSSNEGDSWSLLQAHLPPVISLEACLV